MLIITDRHTKEDIELWKDYNEFDSVTKYSQWKINQAIDIIKQSGASICYTSWGKDSVVLIHLLILSKIKIPVVYVKFSDRSNPDADLVREKFLEMFPIEYHEEVFDYEKVRRTNLHWKIVAKKYPGIRLTGIRKDESGIRNMLFRKDGFFSKNSCRPISQLRNQEIFSYINQNGLPLSPVYGYLGGGRWDRKNIRMHSLAGTTGDNFGRTEWEKEYYGDIINRIKAGIA